jgi:pimeloyl-ACP methyl ester carboxylesterase
MTGVTALLIPGTMCDARIWRSGGDIIRRKLLTALGTQPTDADLNQDDTVEAMASRALRETSGPLLLVGFSMGAIVAVEMALQAPDRICGLILSGYNAGPDAAERASARPLQQDRVRSGLLRDVIVKELKPLYLAAENKCDRELRDLLLDMAMDAGPSVFVRQSEALRNRVGRQIQLSMLGVPTMYLAGCEDRLCPPKWHLEWSTLTPKSCFVEIEGAGHLVPLEQPRQFASAIEQWININIKKAAI